MGRLVQAALLARPLIFVVAAFSGSTVYAEKDLRDIFEQEHMTEFCQIVFWLSPDEKGREVVFGNFDMNRHKAT